MHRRGSRGGPPLRGADSPRYRRVSLHQRFRKLGPYLETMLNLLLQANHASKAERCATASQAATAEKGRRGWSEKGTEVVTKYLQLFA